MKTNKTVKFYGKVIRTWKHWVTRTTLGGKTYEEEAASQYELKYREYLANGELIAAGSEDFSPERRNNLKHYTVYTWDGERRNKGGNRWFEHAMDIVVAPGSKKAALEIVKTWFPTAAMVELR